MPDESCNCEHLSHHSEQLKADMLKRLNKVEGQVRGVKGMIEKNAYCDDVLNQMASIQAAINSVERMLLEAHMKSCVAQRIMQNDLTVVDELMLTMKKLMK